MSREITVLLLRFFLANSSCHACNMSSWCNAGPPTHRNNLFNLDLLECKNSRQGGGLTAVKQKKTSVNSSLTETFKPNSKRKMKTSQTAGLRSCHTHRHHQPGCRALVLLSWKGERVFIWIGHETTWRAMKRHDAGRLD